MGIQHFQTIFKTPQHACLSDIMHIVQEFPRFVIEEDFEELHQAITPTELEYVLWWFMKYKSPDPNGWTIELFLNFYELIRRDLLAVVEKCLTIGQLYDAFNCTFIALTHKLDDPSSFADYCLISLCNVIYNMIAKIIANRIRPILSCHISK